MKIISTLLVLFVAVEYFYIAWLEMTQIPSEKASELFNMPYEFMEQKRVQTLFSNQGLYNGFLAIGLGWARFSAPPNPRFRPAPPLPPGGVERPGVLRYRRILQRCSADAAGSGFCWGWS